MRLNRSQGNVFVANLPPEFSDEELAETFDTFGIVLRASIARDPVTGKRLRYGFVDIATDRAANRAVATMSGTKIHGYTLDVRISDRPAATRKLGRVNHPPQRAPLRLVAHAGAEIEAASDTSYRRPQPRKPPTFQVERRSLPRRT